MIPQQRGTRSKKVRARVACFVAGIIATAVLAACSSSGGTGAPTSGGTSGGRSGTGSSAAPLTTKSKGVLQVGTITADPPFEYVDNNKWTGFDIELVEAIAAKLNLGRVEWTSQSFDTMMTAVSAGRYDLNASGTAGWAPPTSYSLKTVKTRKSVVTFSNPYFLAQVGYASRKADPIETVADLKKGAKIGVLAGTLQSDWADAVLAPKGINVVTYPNDTAAFTALEANQLTGVVEAIAIIAPALKSHTDLQVSKTTIPALEAGYCFSFPKKSTALRDAFNTQLAAMVKSGEYAQIFHKWFPQLQAPQRLPTNS
jgi:polar amino acid transport system substrate-binding protein